MSTRNRLEDTIKYLYIQMIDDGIMVDSKSQQIQYILDMISMFNDEKLDMIEDIRYNIKKFGYKDGDIIALYSILLSNITKAYSKLDIDCIVGKYNPTEDIDKLIGIQYN